MIIKALMKFRFLNYLLIIKYLSDIYKTNKEHRLIQIWKFNGHAMKDINGLKKVKKPIVEKMKEDKEEYIK